MVIEMGRALCQVITATAVHRENDLRIDPGFTQAVRILEQVHGVNPLLLLDVGAFDGVHKVKQHFVGFKAECRKSPVIISR